MRKEFEEKLKADFSNLYKDLYGDPKKTCLARGIETKDGWFELIYDLSKKLEKIIITFPENERYNYRVNQCKEKFGSLRFYLNKYTNEMTELICGAEQRSCNLCEWCGKSATLKQNSNHWLHTICQTCELLK